MLFLKKFLSKKRLAKQLRKPSGILGKVVGKGLAQVNDIPNNWVIDLLKIEPNDYVLEIGFGPGLAIKQVSGLLNSGTVTGLDFSKTMVKEASKLNKEEIRNGKVKLEKGNSIDMPFADSSFSKVFAINVIYFWENPLINIREIYRVLKPGGTLVIYSMGAVDPDFEKMGIFELRGVEEIVRLFKESGFKSVKSETKKFSRPRLAADLADDIGHCIIGKKIYEISSKSTRPSFDTII
jgi:ubiquinone/menaquinone biosynthesis C-methylase UbiE